MIIVTGGAGFIGSRLVRSLVGDGHEVVVVDDATGEGPGGTLHGVDVEDHVGQEAFRAALARPNALRGVDVVLHQGACSDTTEADETFLWDNNVRYSVSVLDACQRDRVPLVYASSAAVHGRGVGGEDPLNGYARSKAAVDAVVRERTPGRRAPIMGLRYFNVYGPGERHKGPMASMVLQVDDQIRSSGVARLFGAGEGAEAGQHRRDFVFVDDVVAVVRWFAEGPDRSGIVDCGTGTSRTFEDLASAVIARRGVGRIEYVPFPESLKGRYQAATCADLGPLRRAGWARPFTPLEDGVRRYLERLDAEAAR